MFKQNDLIDRCLWFIVFALLFTLMIYFTTAMGIWIFQASLLKIKVMPWLLLGVSGISGTVIAVFLKLAD